MERYLEAKSIHIFAWPFKIKREEMDAKAFAAKIKQRGWRKKKFSFLGSENKAEYQNYYMLEQYLSDAASNIFLHPENGICHIYEYPYAEKTDYYYCIDTYDREKNIKKNYELEIDSIEMHVYHNGVGVLWFHVLNMDKNSTLEDIKVINDLGRRVYLPYIPDDADPSVSAGDILCAERLGIKSVTKDINGAKHEKKETITDFREKVRTFHANVKIDAGMMQMAEPVQFLRDTINCELDEEKFDDIRVIPAEDDRMFVISLVRDKALSDKIKAEEEWQQKEFKEMLYTLCYVDKSWSTCQSEKMLDEKLEAALYKRWENYGTLYSVTNYSMLCMTTDETVVNSGVVRPFWTEYKYFVSLVIAQNIGISLFVSDAGRLVKDADKKGLIKAGQAAKLANLQERYVTFKNQLLIPEASCQEQGIEIYQLLQKQLLIEQEKAILDDMLGSVYEIVNVSNEARNNKLVNALTWISVIIAFPSAIKFVEWILNNSIHVLLGLLK